MLLIFERSSYSSLDSYFIPVSTFRIIDDPVIIIIERPVVEDEYSFLIARYRLQVDFKARPKLLQIFQIEETIERIVNFTNSFLRIDTFHFLLRARNVVDGKVRNYFYLVH